MNRLLGVISTLFIFACQEAQQINTYSPPIEIGYFENTFLINDKKDQVKKYIQNTNFSDLVFTKKYSSADKIILSLNPKNVSKFIDCGMMNDEIYVNYINRIFESDLKIKTTILLDSINMNLTKVEVTSEYQFTSIETGTRWNFQTNNPKLILVGTPAYGAEPYRKCMSSNFLEALIIKKITSYMF
jgi:hypothetical protein